MINNYVPYHVHSDLSNGTTNIDSVTKYNEYLKIAKEYDMKVFGFAEHGNIYEWYHKKTEIEKLGMKYIHGCEFYLTEKLYEDIKIRDNYHIVLMAKNYEGFRELNKLTSIASNREDGHFYFTPRITFEELTNTSKNIIVTSACLGGVIGKDKERILKIYSPLFHDINDENELFEKCEEKYKNFEKEYVDWLADNKDRCFLEIQHHISESQKKHNLKLLKLSNDTGIRLIAGTDTHCLNEMHEKGRTMLQRGKKVFFDGEDDWDLKFKSYDQLIEAYKIQDSLPIDTFEEAINNTNVMADMVEEFSLDKNTKYPKLYQNPEGTFVKHVYEKARKHPYLSNRYNWNELKGWLDEEIEVYKKTKSIDFMLLQEYLREKEHEMDVWCGPGRGSVSGSMVAYALGITDMDSRKFGLNFFR